VTAPPEKRGERCRRKKGGRGRRPWVPNGNGREGRSPDPRNEVGVTWNTAPQEGSGTLLTDSETPVHGGNTSGRRKSIQGKKNGVSARKVGGRHLTLQQRKAGTTARETGGKEERGDFESQRGE